MAQDLDAVDSEPITETDRIRIWEQIQSEIPLEQVSPRSLRVSGARWKSFLWPMPITVAAMAIVLIAIAVLIGMNFLRGARPTQEQAVSNRGPEHPGEQVLGEPTPKPATSSVPPTAFRLEKAPVRLPASAVIVWRGEVNSGSAQVKQLEEALAPYRVDDYAASEKRLESVAGKYPTLAEARFYLGVCQLFLNRDQEAVESLKTARRLAKNPLASEAAWYLAIAYHRSGQDVEARPLLDKLCRAGGMNAARACAARTEL
jgi:tetratricopeptide (TPR) repeat protein